jgi:EpsI family protein
MAADLRKAALFALAMVAASLLALAMTPRHHLADAQVRERLDQIVPTSFGGWQVDRSIVPVPPSPDVQQVLDATYDETLARTYRDRLGRRVMLSLAYGRNQHKGMNTHRPEICYPAQGFKLELAGQADELPYQARRLPITRVVAAQGGRHEPITYWLLVGDELTRFGYAQRWSAVRYGLRGIIPDGVLVRVSTIEPDNAVAFQTQDQFIRDLLDAVGPARLPRLIGTASANPLP